MSVRIGRLGALVQVPLTFTLAPHSDADTSRAAAKAIVPHKARLQRRILYALALGDLSDAGIQQITRMDGNTERPRRGELVALGLVARVYGEYDILPSGRAAALWRLTEKGRAAL